jgi:hypothetical protein
VSMRHYPSSGYIVPICQIIKLTPEEHHAKLNELLEDWDYDAVWALFREHLPESFPPFDIYHTNEEDDISECMEHGVFYAIFEEDDLFEKKPTAAQIVMNRLGIVPHLADWSVFG